MKSRFFLLIIILLSVLTFSSVLLAFTIGSDLRELKVKHHESISKVIKTESVVNICEEWKSVSYDFWLSDFDCLGEVISGFGSHFDHFDEKVKVVYWFDQSRSCKICIDEDMEEVKKVINSLEYDCFAILSDFESEKDIRFFEARYGIEKVAYKLNPGVLLSHLNHTSIVRLMFVVDQENKILYPIRIESTQDFHSKAMEKLINFTKRETENQPSSQ